MDPLDRADALLAQAQARGKYVVTPESAVSPMDASNTQQIPRAVVRGADARAIDPDATTILSDDEIREQDDSDHHLADRDPTTTIRLSRDGRGGAASAEPEPEPEETIEVEELDGLIPTTTQRKKSTLSRRLDG